MIDEEDHFTINNEQDFFTLRSHLFAELSLQRIPASILAKVLKKFSSNVHRDCIVRYDIFKRKGYDADITTLAFSKIQDGIDYYENILSMDKSEYRYQQYALYLFRKKQLKEAWNKIETAHSINPNNLAIKNTHAYILFNNNIQIDDDIETVKETIEYTFEVLSDCIKKDMRKTFHVITFAENAISYFRKFVEIEEYKNEAIRYIDMAYPYVCEELNKFEFISKTSKFKLKSLKREIEDITHARNL
jgi:tetratricopeptide (TPR) repeat protein